VGCTTCPCTRCPSTYANCCTYPRSTDPICTPSATCPPTG
jgi:hypothetical protein